MEAEDKPFPDTDEEEASEDVATDEHSSPEDNSEEEVLEEKTEVSPLDLFRTLFRLLTPGEVSDLTTISTGEKRIALTLILDGYEEGQTFDELVKEHEEEEEEEEEQQANNGAKIIPFTSSGDDEVDEMMEQMSETYLDQQGQEESGSKVVETQGHPGVEKSKPISAKEKAPVSDEPLDRNTFILDVKEKMKKSQKALKEKEVLNLYQKNAEIDIEQEKTLKEDLSKSTNMGVLVNKRQF